MVSEKTVHGEPVEPWTDSVAAIRLRVVRQACPEPVEVLTTNGLALPPFALSLSKGEWAMGWSWFDRLTTNGLALPPFALSLSKGEWARDWSWFDRLTTNGLSLPPFALSLSKGERARGWSWFDRLTTNGSGLTTNGNGRW